MKNINKVLTVFSIIVVASFAVLLSCSPPRVNAASSQKVVYSAGGGIKTMNIDGSNQQTVFATDGSFTSQGAGWSPDGTKVVFSSNVDGDYDIYIMDADGSNLTNLTNNSNLNDESAYWSPDGSMIAYRSRNLDSSGPISLLTMSADGTPVGTIISLEAVESGIVYASWSPDSQKVAYTAKDDSTNFQIFISDNDGSNPTQLTSGARNSMKPVWSPDGIKVFYVSYGSDPSAELKYISPEGGTDVTINSSLNFGVVVSAWLPNSLSVITSAFDQDVNQSRYNVYIADALQDSSIQALTNITSEQSGNGAEEIAVVDNNSFIYTANADNGREIFFSSIDGSGVVNLTNSSDTTDSMSWQAVVPINNDSAGGAGGTDGGGTSTPGVPRTGVSKVAGALLAITVLIVSGLAIYQANKVYAKRKQISPR